MVNYEALYPGATYFLDPSYNFLGYRVPTGEIGGTTSIQTANQLKEVSKLLNQGMKVTEVSVIHPEVFEMMPKDHLKEILRLNKLTGAESTMHAPLIEPSGVTEQGWSEENQRIAEEQIQNIVNRSHELNPKGNIPVTIHASNLPGTEMIPEKEKGEGPEMGRMVIIDQETGRPTALERQEVFYPETTEFKPGEKPRGEIFKPEGRVEMVNYNQWRKAITDLDFYKKEADEMILKEEPNLFPYFGKLEKGEEITREEYEHYNPSIEKIDRAGRWLQNVKLSFQHLFERAAKYGELDKKVMDTDGKIKTVRGVLNEISDDWKKHMSERNRIEKKGHTQVMLYHPLIIKNESNLLDKSMEKLSLIGSPKQFIQIEDFTKQKSSETLSNVALNAFKKFGDTAPIISVENPPYGMAIASGKDLKELVQETRNKFVEKAVKDPKLHMSKSEAERAAEKLIGVTWDTSHISMMRKQGFKGEDVVKETREVAPLVKHLHYNDNFGSTHTDLPPGMGSLPMKDILKELEKGGFKGKKIFEGGNFFQHFQTSPFVYTLETGGAPLYAAGGAPFWNQVWGYFAPYYMGHGAVNPTIHHQTYGAGFMTLPTELGGEIPGGQGRFAGTPMQ